jgi:DNA-binding response OmpR family regulator
VKVLLIDSESPVSERLIEEISELSNVQVMIQEPSDWDPEHTAAKPHFDVILVDIDHSRGLGLDIIRRIRGQRGEKKPVIMAIASSPSLQYRASCLDAGAMYFFNRTREQDWLLDSLASIREQLE